MRLHRNAWLAGVLAGLATLVLVGSASAQQRIGSSTGSSMGSSGSSFGGSGSSSFGGSGTFSGSGTGFTGGNSFGSSGSTGGRSGSGAASYGQSSPYGTYFANPFALGLATSSVGSGASANSSKYLRPYPVQLSFGQPLFNTTTTGGSASVGRGGVGSSGIGSSGFGSSGFGSSGIGSTGTGMRMGGMSSQGIRRAPSYMTELALGESNTRPSGRLTASPELQRIIDRSTRLPSRSSIRVSTDSNGVVVLRGRVRDAHERVLAESVLRLSPGVFRVRNDLRVPNATRRR
jgi:hypothetical protein